MSPEMVTVTVRCQACSREITERPRNTDPWETKTVLMVCAKCTTDKAMLADCTFLDPQGNELDAVLFEGR